MNSAVKEDIVLYSALSKADVDKNIINQKIETAYKKIGVAGAIGIVVGLLVIIAIISKR